MMIGHACCQQWTGSNSLNPEPMQAPLNLAHGGRFHRQALEVEWKQNQGAGHGPAQVLTPMLLRHPNRDQGPVHEQVHEQEFVFPNEQDLPLAEYTLRCGTPGLEVAE